MTALLRGSAGVMAGGRVVVKERLVGDYGYRLGKPEGCSAVNFDTNPIFQFTRVYLVARLTMEHCFCRAFRLLKFKVESPVGFDKSLESLNCSTKSHGYDIWESYLLA